MKQKVKLLSVLCSLSFIVALGYFLNNETTTIYGDDLDFYIKRYQENSLLKVFSNLGDAGKFRPVSMLVAKAGLHLFGKNLHSYFLFNVGVQSLIICAFAFLLRLFLRNMVVSWLLALPVGLSRFAHYNIAQIYTGGPLEGLGLLVFVVTLYYLFKFMLDEKNERTYSARYLWWALFFAHVNVYVHERYITVLPFVAMLALFYPLKSKLLWKQKSLIVAVSALLVLSNYLLKTCVYHYGFFRGTGGDQQMKFNVDSMLGFLQDAVLSMVQYNSGEQGWTGLNFTSVDLFHQVMASVAMGGILLMFILFFATAARAGRTERKNEHGKTIYVVVALLMLMILCLVPAISTVRMEHRWLQAPFTIMILALIFAVYNARIKPAAVKHILAGAVALCFCISDYLYYESYKKYSYWNGAEYTAKLFREAYFNGTIRKSTRTLYVFVEDRVHFPSSGFLWILEGGKFFEYYAGRAKNMAIIDTGMFHDRDQLPCITALNKETEQVIGWDGSHVSELTDKVLSDRARLRGDGAKPAVE